MFIYMNNVTEFWIGPVVTVAVSIFIEVTTVAG